MNNIYNRDNCPCNFCKHLLIDDQLTYVCTKRDNKAIIALNPDIESNHTVTDNVVSRCRLFILDPDSWCDRLVTK